MKSKSMLFMMELIAVILFFSLSAAICLKVFTEAKLISDNGRNIGKATAIIQSCAEVYKSVGGNINETAEILDADINDNRLELYYDGNWNECCSNPVFTITLRGTEDLSDVTVAEITAAENGVGFYSVEVAAVVRKENADES